MRSWAKRSPFTVQAGARFGLSATDAYEAGLAGDGAQRARVSLVPRTRVRPCFYSGGRSPGDLSHSFKWEAISACRALRIISSRATLGGSNLASARRRFASSESRSSSDEVCLKRRRCFMTLPRASDPKPWVCTNDVICRRPAFGSDPRQIVNIEPFQIPLWSESHLGQKRRLRGRPVTSGVP